MPTARTFRFHPLAWEELEAAEDRYQAWSSDAGLEFLSDLDLAVEDILQAPQRWPKYLYGTRRVVLQRFPFSVIYLDDPDVITIIAVAHSKRRPGYWKDRL
jgi:plasmid stabilization system protein ParE